MVAVSFLRGPTSVGAACCYTTRRQAAADSNREDNMPHLRMLLLALLTVSLAGPEPAHAQVTLTMSSWVSPQHHLTSVVLQGWATEVEKAKSEEHTSELQSRPHLVCRLLLEKKKKITT